MEGDSKGIKELSGAYSSFTKTAQIDTVIEAANNDVIATVADLGDFIEKSGGEFTYYDNVDRDIVDKTIKDMKKYVQDLVGDATGLTTQLEAMRASYQASVEQQATDNATSALSIQDIIDEQMAGNAAFDSELELETLDEFEIEEDDDNF
jgi:phage-related minor tail protein